MKPPSNIISDAYSGYYYEEPKELKRIILESLESTPISKKKEEFNDKERKDKIKNTNKERLAPLKEVFFEKELMDDLIIHNSIPDLLEGNQPSYRGTVLYGPPGTGKSEFQKSVCEVYENCGAYSKQAPLLNDIYVASFARNLEGLLKEAQKEGERRKLPSFLAFDEGTSFAQDSKIGASSVSKHYQEAIDVLKKYVGNDCGNWLVLSISTNEDLKYFDPAVIREGRLKPFYIGGPSPDQLSNMWKFFLNKYELIHITNEQSKSLGDLSFKTNEKGVNVNGSFIEEFSRTFLTKMKQKEAIQNGYSSLLDSLSEGYSSDPSKLKKGISYQTIYETLSYELENNKKPTTRPIGFK